jgi:L-serine/L-threonine ammonia-lyase
MCVELGDARVRVRACDDAHAVAACLRFADDHRVLVEPACGAALSAAYFPELGALDGISSDPRAPIVVVVCGGSVIDRASMNELAKAFSLA